MRRFVVILWLLLVKLPAFSQGISRLENVKPGTTVIVETTDPWGGAAFDRCKLIDVEAGALTCVDVLGTHGREVFPIRQLDAVYEIHKDHTRAILAWIGVALVTALAIGGAVSGNPGLYLLALIIGGVGLAAATDQFPPAPRRVGPYGPPYAAAPQPWEKGETGRLVYVRRWGPPPVP